ncbi:MAG: NfeD family protein [Candidatus Helarchaeota archaeon]
MLDKKLWSYVFFTAILELVIIFIVTLILILYFPAINGWIILGAVAVTVGYLWIHYKILKPVFGIESTEFQDELIGWHGVTITDLNPRGQVKVQNEVWSARSASGFLSAGLAKKVLNME